MPDYENFIAIGKIVKPIGIKGNLKVISLTDFPERFNKLSKVLLYSEIDKLFCVNKFDGSLFYNVSECRIYDSYINIKFDHYDEINISKPLVNLLLMIDEKDRIKLKDGSYYFYDLVGAEVFDKEVLIGNVISVVNYGSGDLFNVRFKDKEILIPYRDEFIRSIDIDKKRIDVDLIEGFLD